MRGSFERLETLTVEWHHQRNLIEGSTDRKQLEKLSEEFIELVVAVTEKDELETIDALGDMLVVMINIAERNNLTMTHCLARAYSMIKDRTGRMINGKFVKEESL